MRNRGIGRGRMFVGGMLLFGATIAWATAFLMNPYSPVDTAGPDHVRTTVAVFLRNSAAATLLLSGLAAYLLFPARRPRAPTRDRLLIALLALLVLSSLFQLVWVEAKLLR